MGQILSNDRHDARTLARGTKRSAAKINFIAIAIIFYCLFAVAPRGTFQLANYPEAVFSLAHLEEMPGSAKSIRCGARSIGVPTATATVEVVSFRSLY